MPRDVTQVQLDLFDEEFERDVEMKGVAGALLEKEIDAKAKGLSKKLSASQRAKSEKLIRKLVKEATSKPGKLTTDEVVAVGRKINELRGMYASFSDLENDHGKRLWPTEKNLIKWAKHPDKSDLLGVDNRKKTDATHGENKGRRYKILGFI